MVPVIRFEGRETSCDVGTRLRDANAALDDLGLAFPILGSVAEQSLAGAVSTGTHGSSVIPSPPSASFWQNATANRSKTKKKETRVEKIIFTPPV